ncbi:MAG: DUF1080 domain-containing protein [Tannerella sp.]|jgi:hypothetical protein|nr:DUF1080 domain-containing protein [Tannerella sp.]
MKKLYILTMILGILSGCADKKETPLFNGKDLNLWQIMGDAEIRDDSTFTLYGKDTELILEKGSYKNFELAMKLRTVDGGKGEILFHTDKTGQKGYKIAINNDLSDPVWWKMTGSLVGVRNLPKSLAKDGEWFLMTVKVEGQKISVLINEEPVVAYMEPAEPYRLPENSGQKLSEGAFRIKNTSEQGKLEFAFINVASPDSVYDTENQLAEAIDEQTDEIIRLHQEDFPVLDYHVHLKGGLTKEGAGVQSRAWGINYALAPNCGIGFPITNDQQVIDYLDSMRSQPFILAMQAEGREWVTTFSPDVRAEFDYVFTDALTFTDGKGRRTRLWIPEETWIENEQKYMDLIVDRICMVLQEPFDIYVNPCFLPSPMNERYDEFWTEERMNKFVSALAASGKALEINDRYKIPNQAIIQKAKDAGVKFSFGTNNGGNDLEKLSYCIAMKKACNITAGDMYKPKLKL